AVGVWMGERHAEGQPKAYETAGHRALVALTECAQVDRPATVTAGEGGRGAIGRDARHADEDRVASDSSWRAARSASARPTRPTSLPSDVVTGELSSSCATMYSA